MPAPVRVVLQRILFTGIITKMERYHSLNRSIFSLLHRTRSAYGSIIIYFKNHLEVPFFYFTLFFKVLLYG